MTALPEKMTAVSIPVPGGPDVLLPQQRYVPIPHEDDILIKVAAAGVNRPDLFQRAGAYPPPPGASDLPGLEVSGMVVACGPKVHLHKIGDRVTALVPGGGYAEYCKVNEGHALPVPKGLSMVEAAAIPETFFTVWTNVFDGLKLKAGERFLVHGGASGIGTTAIQLAKAFGAEVFTTVGSDEKVKVVQELGADVAVNYNKDDFVAVFRKATNEEGIHAILDMIGGDYVQKNWKVAAVDGRICQIATLNGPSDDLDFALLMMKRLVHTGSTLRPRDTAFKSAIAASLKEKVWPLIEAGTVKPLIDSTYPLTEAAEAHRHMETSSHIGKIVLTVGEAA